MLDMMMTSNEATFDVRGSSRKRRESGDDMQPLFLRKAYSMITNCPAEIGGWSKSGDTFIIKDADRFAEEIIPTVYKHNKFSSFVRQLNFYGFRKVKSDIHLHSSYWEFRHPLFRRGHPQLLGEIKKAVHSEVVGANVGEVQELKGELSRMKDNVFVLESTVQELTSLVSRLINSAPASACSPTAPSSASSAVSELPPAKRSKCSPSSVGSVGFDVGALESFETEDFTGWDDFQHFFDDYSDPVGPALSIPPSAQATIDTTVSASTQIPMSDVLALLPSLTQDLQHRFVDQLAASLGDRIAAAFSSASSVSVNAVEPLAVPVAPMETPKESVVAPGEAVFHSIASCLNMAAMTMSGNFGFHQGASVQGSGCTCSSCRMVFAPMMHPQQCQIPAVAYPLAAATIGAFANYAHRNHVLTNSIQTVDPTYHQ